MIGQLGEEVIPPSLLSPRLCSFHPGVPPRDQSPVELPLYIGLRSFIPESSLYSGSCTLTPESTVYSGIKSLTPDRHVESVELLPRGGAPGQDPTPCRGGGGGIYRPQNGCTEHWVLCAPEAPDILF